MVIKFGQAPLSLKIVSCGKSNFAKKNSSTVTMVAAAHKRSVTITLSTTSSGEFLPVPANMTKNCQPLDLTVNGYAKKFLAKYFNEWYTAQISKQLKDGKGLEGIDVKLCVPILKPLHAEALMSLYNKVTSSESKKIVNGGWWASGITDSIKIVSPKLPSIYRYRSNGTR